MRAYFQPDSHFSRILVQQNVLHTACSYFRDMRTHETMEKRSEELKFEEVSGIVLGQLVDHAYTEQICICTSNVHEILVAAKRYGFGDVVEICENFYAAAIDTSNAFQTQAIAKKYRLEDLEVAARQFVNAHFMDIVKQEEFLAIDVVTLVGLLEKDGILIDSEQDVFNAIVRWIDVAREERKIHYPALMKTVRMSRIESKVSLVFRLHCIRIRKQSVYFIFFQFLHGPILDYYDKLGMRHVFVDACEEKHRQDVKVTDGERVPRIKHIFAAGVPQKDGVVRIDRYAIASDTWETVRRIEKVPRCRIHCIDNSLFLFGNLGTVFFVLCSVPFQTHCISSIVVFEGDAPSIGQHGFEQSQADAI